MAFLALLGPLRLLAREREGALPLPAEQPGFVGLHTGAGLLNFEPGRKTSGRVHGVWSHQTAAGRLDLSQRH